MSEDKKIPTLTKKELDEIVARAGERLAKKREEEVCEEETRKAELGANYLRRRFDRKR